MSWFAIISAILPMIGTGLQLWLSDKKKRDAREMEVIERRKNALKDAFDAIDDGDESALVLAIARMR